MVGRRLFLAGLLATVAAPVLAQGLGFGLGLQDVTTRVGGGAPLDGFTQPAGAYSFRKLKSNYAGSAVRLRRTTGGEQDVGFTGTDFDTAAATTFCAATTCFIRTWYDQSGGTRHLTQVTAANQPQLIFNCIGANPCFRTTASTVTLIGPSLTPAGGVVSFSAVSQRTSGTGVCILLGENGPLNRLTHYNVAGNYFLASGAGSIIAPATENVPHAVGAVINGASSYVMVDGTITTGTVTGSVAAGATTIQGTSTTVCEQGEVIFWDAYALTQVEAAALGQNQRDYWMPLPLDTFATPAGAYSFRKLKSTYAGPAIRIRRALDDAETDIGFVGYVPGLGSPIDFVAANTHCAATSCYIHTFYDQSGNTRHLTNAVAVEQPQLIFNCIGTLPCMRGTQAAGGNSGNLTYSTATGGAVTYSAVSRLENTAQTIVVYTGGPFLYFNATIIGLYNSSVSFTVPHTPGAWHAMAGTIAGAASNITVDGTTTAGTLAYLGGGGPVITGTGTIGAAASTTELVFWDSSFTMTAAQQVAWTQNQRSFWGF